jgi:hypothetical protein
VTIDERAGFFAQKIIRRMPFTQCTVALKVPVLLAYMRIAAPMDNPQFGRKPNSGSLQLM